MNVRLHGDYGAVILTNDRFFIRSSGGLVQRQPKGDLRASARFAGNLDGSAVQSHDAFDQRKAQSESSRSGGSRGFNAIEAIEHVRDVFRRDPTAGVRHLNTERIAVAGCLHRCVPSWRRVIDGVLNQVADGALPQRPVQVRG